MSLINTRSCNEASTLPLKLVLRRDSVVLSSQIGHRRLLSECWLESSLLCFSSSFYASVPGRPWKMAQVVRPLLCILGRQGLSTSLLALAQALMLGPFGEQKKWWTCSYQWMITLPFQLLTLKLSFYILKKCLTYLFERLNKEDTEGVRSFIHWFIAAIAAIIWSGIGKTEEPSRSHTWWWEPKHWGHLMLSFEAYPQEIGSEFA